MKGYYRPLSTAAIARHSVIMKCDHPLFSSYSVYKNGDFGLGVVQKRFNSNLKVIFWGPIDPWLSNDIYEETGFMEVFNKHCGILENGMYPVMNVRILMYELGMKPMKKEFWEKF